MALYNSVSARAPPDSPERRPSPFFPSPRSHPIPYAQGWHTPSVDGTRKLDCLSVLPGLANRGPLAPHSRAKLIIAGVDLAAAAPGAISLAEGGSFASIGTAAVTVAPAAAATAAAAADVTKLSSFLPIDERPVGAERRINAAAAVIGDVFATVATSELGGAVCTERAIAATFSRRRGARPLTNAAIPSRSLARGRESRW